MYRRFLFVAGIAAVLFAGSACNHQSSSNLSPSDSTGQLSAEARAKAFPMDSLNYALGLGEGKLLSKHNIDFQKDPFMRGLKDGLKDEGKITEEQMQQLIQRFFEIQRAQTQEENLGKSLKALDSVSRLEGVVRDESGLLYRIVEEGDGAQPTDTSYVQVHYTGYMMNGEQFESSREGDPVTFRLNGVIPGWTIGLQRIKEGGSIQLYIPADLAYGEYGGGPIGPNMALHFDVDLLKVLTADEYKATLKNQ